MGPGGVGEVIDEVGKGVEVCREWEEWDVGEGLGWGW